MTGVRKRHTLCFSLVNSTGNQRQLALQALDDEMIGFARDCADLPRVLDTTLS
jgi:hypothetical protein